MSVDDWAYSYDTNPYYNPEAVGLATVAELEMSSGSYEFNLLVVWKDTATGRLYYGEDSGCSCPSPFDDVRGLNDLTPINKSKELRDHIEGILNEDSYVREYVSPDDIRRVEAAVREALKVSR